MKLAVISILCCLEDSTYNSIPGLDLWPKSRDAFNFTGSNPVIAHPPCAQWSRMRSFAKPDYKEKLLADWCWEIVCQNGGIFEHPAGSSFWKRVNPDRSKLLQVEQCWWGFPARKRTVLYFNKCTWQPFPLFTLPYVSDLTALHSSQRSRSTLSFNQWLTNSVRTS